MSILTPGREPYAFACVQLNGGWFDVQLKTISHHVQENETKNISNGQVIVVQNEG